MSPEPSRDVVLPLGQYDDLSEVCSLARYAEELAYGFLTTGETSGRNVPTVLGVLASETDEIGITNDVISPYSRSPALIGQTAVTIQELSGGRYRLRIGASSPALAEDWHGVEFDRPLRRVRETIEIVRQVQSGDRLDYDGDIYTPDGIALGCAPPEEPAPVDVAALGPKATELAGRFADGWVPQLIPYEGFRDRIGDLRRGVELGDRSVDDVRVAYTLRCCALEDRETAREYARSQVAFMIALYGPFYRKAIAEAGWETVTETVRETWLDGDKSGAIEAVPDELLDEVVAAGTPEEARRQVERFEAIEAVDSVQIGFFDGMDDAERRRTLEALAP
ncbi:TIGR04024 family LLM class F420-dependent oxidoreductase [Natronomonas sp. F2-12]|jgi:coenzyme F420-dependent oxidoreductase|uniref:TIGR04024 family LLM class F420-dependent oxidoreductase n=1 Tax=Natronomonas aquatica TaxID=2841590 RepID=A0A9R1D5W0_9EURY|nr:TIGR04024 family LLM class F420-dependent oxidoreductase [Natronomonas aquatica]MCQ4332743.1 TIGR04024 family LLM class F420-dependent oxidoreductase [Natronomonas aquatica]